MLRTTTSQANRNQSSRQTLSVKPQKPTDIRPIREQKYLYQTVYRLHSYLSDWYFDAPSEKQLTLGLTLRYIIDIINFLLEKLEINVEPISTDTKNQDAVGKGIATVVQILGYPESSAPKPTDLRACSYTQTYRKYLVFMAWLAELTDYTRRIEPQVDDISTEQFIKDLCCSEDPNSLLLGSAYLYFFAQLYDQFLQHPDEEVLRQSLYTNFDLWAGNAQQNEALVKSEMDKIQGDIVRLNQTLGTDLEVVRAELLKLQQAAAGSDVEISDDSTTNAEPSFELLIHLKQRHLEKLDFLQSQLADRIQVRQNQEIVQLNDKIANFDREIRASQLRYQELEAELKATQSQVSSYQVQISDYEQIEFSNQQLQKQAAEAEKELEIMKAQCYDKLLRLYKITSSIYQNSTLLGLQQQQLTIKSLTQKLEETKTEGKQIQQQLQVVNQAFQTYEVRRLYLEAELGKAQQEADKYADSLKQQKASLVARYQQRYNKDDEMQKQYVQLKQSIAQLKMKQQQLEFDLQQLQNQNQIVFQQADREAKKATEELEKLSRIVGALTQQINESRNQARGYLETIRDKIGEALKACDRE